MAHTIIHIEQDDFSQETQAQRRQLENNRQAILRNFTHNNRQTAADKVSRDQVAINRTIYDATQAKMRMKPVAVVAPTPKPVVKDIAIDMGIGFFGDDVPLQRSAMEIDLGIPFFYTKTRNNN